MQVFLQTFISGISFGAIYAIVAMGFSIVYRTMGLVNFAHANVVMLGAYISSTFVITVKLPFAVSVLLAILVTGVVGLVIERILRPLEGKDFDLMLIGTIGFGIVLQALAILIWGSAGRAVPTPYFQKPIRIAGLIVQPYDLLIIGVAVVSGAVLYVFLQKTRTGAAMQAVAMDPEAATSVGIHVGRSNAIAFGIGAALAAVAGGLAGPVLYVSPGLGDQVGIVGFAAAILGGFGNIQGAVVGGLGFGLLSAFAEGHFEGDSQIVVFLVFAAIVVLRPQGILGEQTVSRA